MSLLVNKLFVQPQVSLARSDALRAQKQNQNNLLTCKSLIKIMEKNMPHHKIKRFHRTGRSKNVDANSEKIILITMVINGYKWAKYT